MLILSTPPVQEVIFFFFFFFFSLFSQFVNFTGTALKGVNAFIPAGKFTAILGMSGSGKSTIIQLLERFYDPIERGIFIDGHDLKDVDVKYLRSLMRVVSQEPALLSTTI